MDPSPDDTTPPVDQALLTFRIIGASLGLGVTLFAVVAWFSHQQGSMAAPAVDGELMVNIMLALAFGGSLAAIVLWRARVAPLIERPTGPEDQAGRLAALQTSVIVVWALIEGPALFAEVVYFLYGTRLAGLLGVVLIWAGLAATWPKREWLEARRGY